MKVCRLLFCLCVFCTIGRLDAQDFSNKGKEFWLVFPPHQPAGTSLANLSVYLTSDKNSSGKIEYNGTIQTFIVVANQTTEVILVRSASYISGTESANDNTAADRIRIVTNKGIKITVDAGQSAVVAYAHMFAGNRSAASLILPTTVLGKSYYALSWNQNPTNSSNGEFARSQFSVIATEDNTSLRISLKKNGIASATPILVDLPNKGNVYQFQDASDLSGTLIESIGSGSNSCKKIGVFSGSSSLGIGTTVISPGCSINNNSIDPLYQQCYPINSWGRKFGITPFRGKNKLNYRIIASEDNTIITTNSSDPIILNKGQFFTGFSDFNIINSYKAPLIIDADKPIAVAQFSLTQSCDLTVGDPDMIFLNPVEQSISDITVFLSSKNLIIDQNINVFIKNSGSSISSFKINGLAIPSSSFIPIGTSGYSYLQQQIIVASGSSSSIRLSSDSGFNAIAYGFGNAESYGYSAGTNVIDLNPPISISNEFSATNVSFSATCSNTPFKINLSLTYQPTKIEVDFSGNPNLVGANKYPYDNPVLVSTDIVNGKTFYKYTIPTTYKFSAAGTYPVKITTTSSVTQTDGCSNNNEQEITDNLVVNAPPTADFAVSTNNCFTAPVSFTDVSDGLGRPIVRWIWEFSDGTTSNIKNPIKTFSSANNHSVKLTSVTDFGCIATVTKPVNLSAKPTAAFTVSSLRCENGNITFTDASSIAGSATIAKYIWNLDNGLGADTLTANTSRITTYNAWGNKNPFLVTESNTGCVSDTFRLHAGLLINPLPKVGFVIPEVCLSDAFAPFIDTTKIADNTNASFVYSWKFDDGISTVNPLKRPIPLFGSIPNPIPSYKDTGNYIVSLKVTSGNGCEGFLSSPFTVNGDVPTPDFNVQSNPICINDSIRITNTSRVNFGTTTRIDVFWNNVLAPTVFYRDENPKIGAGDIYANLYPNFASPALINSKDFIIKLIAYSGNSAVCRKSIEKPITINNSPKATFTDIRDICYDAAPRLLNQGSFISVQASTASYFGKGISTAGLLNPVTTGVGSDIIKYLVQNTAGCKDSALQPLEVWPSPVAKWGVTSPLCEKNNISFTDSSIANFSNIIFRNWIFGDATIQTNNTSAVFTKKYDTTKIYLATLQVTTDSGCISTINQQSVDIKPLPTINYTLPSICLPDGRGTFTNQSTIVDNSEALFSYSWNFGDINDPTSSTLKEPTHKYIALGPNNIKLKITTKDGCIDSLSKVLTTIYPWPKANFSANPINVCLGDTILFNDLGNGLTSAAVSWNWNLAGGFNSVLQNPKRQFTDSGTFNISYYFFNAQGCVSDTVSKDVIVNPYPKLSLIPKANVLEGGSYIIRPKYVYGNNLTYLWTPPTYLSSDIDSIPVTTPLGDITYRLNLTGIGGCTVTDTIFIKLLLTPLVPNAFTPNGDGINDRWRIKFLEDYPGATVDVYNRYGQSVFSLVGYDVDWDGTVNGKALPIGTYYYVINPKNGRKIISGSITIIK